MTDSPLGGRTAPEAPKQRVYISASNHLFLALKTFAYSLLGYAIVAVIILILVAILTR